MRRMPGGVTPRERGWFMGWIWAALVSAAGYLVGVLGGGLVLQSLLAGGDRQTALSIAWLPTVLAGVLCGVAAGLTIPARSWVRWWHPVIACVPAVLGAYALTRGLIDARGLPIPGVLPSSVIQLAVAAAFAGGVWVMRGWIAGSGRGGWG